jgi:hypothetical protein
VQENAKKEAIKREDAYARVTQWQDGKMVQSKYEILLEYLLCLTDY